MADWLRLSPPDGPAVVQTARQAVQALADALPEDRERIEISKAALVEAERHDREAVAKQMRAGEDPVSDTAAIAQAREQVGAAERIWQGRRLAVETAQQELGDAIMASRAEWLRAAQRDLTKSHTRALKALDGFETALAELGRQRAIVWWLTPDRGLDRAQQWPAGGLLSDARSSAHAMANSSPASLANLMAWVRELVGDAPGDAHQSREAAVAGARDAA
jgi:hypothetical protein